MHYNKLSTLKRTATHCNALQRTATHCNAPQRTATHRNALQRTATHRNALQRTATHCNVLHCNTLSRIHDLISLPLCMVCSLYIQKSWPLSLYSRFVLSPSIYDSVTLYSEFVLFVYILKLLSLYIQILWSLSIYSQFDLSLVSIICSLCISL